MNCYSFNKITLLWHLLLLAGFNYPVKAQQGPQVKLIQYSPVLNEKLSQLTLWFKITQGYHIQSNHLNEYLIPTTLSFSSSKEIEIGEAIFPEPELFRAKDSSEDVFVFADTVVVQIPLLISNSIKTKTGTYPLRGTLNYQACSDSRCFYPRKYSFTIAIPVSGKKLPHDITINYYNN